MHFSRLLLGACLTGGQWLFVLTGVLALSVILSDWLRGDGSGRPEVMLLIGVGSLALAAVFHLIGRYLKSAHPME